MKRLERGYLWNCKGQFYKVLIFNSSRRGGNTSTSLEHGASPCCGVREGHCAAFMGVKEALDGGVGILDALQHGNWWKSLPS